MRNSSEEMQVAELLQNNVANSLGHVAERSSPGP
jgi:hypothetical protein